MAEPPPQPAVQPPRPPFQFSLRTLLLLFVVLGSSLGVFGAWGIVAFSAVVALAVIDLYRTNYVAVVGPDAAWAGGKPRNLDDLCVAGGPSKTVMVIEVTGAGIPWAEPRDLSQESLSTAGTKLPTVALAASHSHFEDFFTIHHREAGVNVAMADGSVRFLRTGGLTREELWKKLQIGSCREEDFGRDVNSAESWRLNWPNIAALAVWLLSVGTLLVGAVRGRKAAARLNSPVDR